MYRSYVANMWALFVVHACCYTCSWVRHKTFTVTRYRLESYVSVKDASLTISTVDKDRSEGAEWVISFDHPDIQVCISKRSEERKRT